MTTETLHFDNARTVQSLIGNSSRNLDIVEQQLGVKATARDGWIKLEGDAEAVEQASQLFKQIEGAVKSGSTVRPRDFIQALAIMKNEGSDALRGLFAARIQTSPKKAPVTPKTSGQRRYVEAILSHDVTFGVGPAGTGKTYLAMAMAVSALREEKVSRIILTRPAVEAGEALGYLPGDLDEKLEPYLRPLQDALLDMLPAEEIVRHRERWTIEIAPLAYMRGRTLSDAFIILDEAQNSTGAQMKMFLTRLGVNSKVVVTGDKTQIDLPSREDSGLIQIERILLGIEGIAFCYLDEKDVVRHRLVRDIIRAYAEDQNG